MDMGKFLSYNEFLRESLEVPLVKDPSDFVVGILIAAKKKKLLKGIQELLYKGRELPEWAKDNPGKFFSYNKKYLCFERIIKVDGNAVVAGLLINGMSYHSDIPEYRYSDKNIDPAQVLLVSNNPMNIVSLEKIFDDEILATLGKTANKFTRKTIVDNSKVKAKIDTYKEKLEPDYTRSYPITAPDQKYFVVFEYTKEEQAVVPVTFDELKNTASYKDLMDSFPLEMISGDLQRRKMTIVFAIKASHLFDVKSPSRFVSEKYWHTGYALYERGYIRNYSTTGGQHNVAGSFNATSLSGWEEGLKEVKNKFAKRIKDMEKEGILVDLKKPIDYNSLAIEIQQKLIDLAKRKELEWSEITKYISPELYQKYRGGIHSSQFGL